MKPARRVVTRSPSNNVGVVCCPWLQPDPIEFESILERWFLMIAVLLPRLKRIEHQPFRLELPPFGEETKGTTYVPDFLLHFESGESVVIEVKPCAFLKKHCDKLLAAAEVLRAKGQAFFVITDKALRSTAPMADAMQIRRMAKGQCSDEEVARTLAILADQPSYLSARDLRALARVELHVIAWLVGRRPDWHQGAPCCRRRHPRDRSRQRGGLPCHAINWPLVCFCAVVNGCSRSAGSWTTQPSYWRTKVPGRLSNLSVAKLSADVLDGTLALVHTTYISPAAGEPEPPSINLVGSLDSIPERYRKELLRRRAYIGHLRRQGLTRGMRRAIKKCLANLKVSPKTADETEEADADPTDKELRGRLTLPVPSASHHHELVAHVRARKRSTRCADQWQCRPETESGLARLGIYSHLRQASGALLHPSPAAVDGHGHRDQQAVGKDASAKRAVPS